MSNLIPVIEPTMVLNEDVCKSNIARMAQKAKAAGVTFRPHFKTHQSREIGEWFRKSGVEKITVSSLNMAMKFAEWGWNDITVAFPVNCLEHEKINYLASKIRLNLLLAHSEGAQQLSACLKYPVGVYLSVDTGYHRDGVDANNYEKIDRIINIVAPDVNIKFEGFLTHAGHTYHARSKEEVLQIHRDNLRMLKNIKERYINRYPQLKISLGDTPSCSLADRFGVASEIRPGNFVFYDVTQMLIGSCAKQSFTEVETIFPRNTSPVPATVRFSGWQRRTTAIIGEALFPARSWFPFLRSMASCVVLTSS